MKFNSVRTYNIEIYETIKILTKREPKRLATGWWLQNINLMEINLREVQVWPYFTLSWFIFAIDEISIISWEFIFAVARFATCLMTEKKHIFAKWPKITNQYILPINIFYYILKSVC